MSTGDEHLQAWLSAFLGGEEQLQWELTNVQTGVTRAQDGDEEAITPPESYGAVAAVTDKRVLFLVGGADDGSDDVTSIPHEEIAGVTATEELITCKLILTTGAGAVWRFTVREPGDLDEAVAYLDDQIAGAKHVHRVVETARNHSDGVDTVEDKADEFARYDAAIDAYRQAVTLQTSPGVDADVDTQQLREEVLETVEDAFDARVTWARQERSRGNWEYQAGNEDNAYEHFATALDSFERAHEIARETPAGDAESIGAERSDLVRRLETLDITSSVAAAETD